MNYFSFFLSIFFSIWLATNLVPFLSGLVDGHRNAPTCKDKMAKIEYIFPGYQLGCYMGNKE